MSSRVKVYVLDQSTGAWVARGVGASQVVVEDGGRVSVRVAFEDFVMINIIGKGTFGKVYLVQNKHTEQLYAMKSIRKDIVIEHDSLENLHLEKQILNQVNHPFIISMDYVFIKDFRIYFIMDFIQ